MYFIVIYVHLLHLFAPTAVSIPVFFSTNLPPRKGRKALQLITGTVELCSTKSCCLRLGNGKVYGLSSAEFYSRLCNSARHVDL